MYRLATLNDIPQLALLKLKMFEANNMQNMLRENFIEEVIKTYSDLYKSTRAQHFVIEDNGQIIACAGAFIKKDIPYCFYKNEEYGFIGDVYVKPNYRRRGYARILTNAMLHFFTTKGIHTIRLLATPNARNLYKSLGFKETDEMILSMLEN